MACGGDGGSPAPAAVTFPLQKAVVNLYTTGFQKTLSVSGTATANGTQFPLTGSIQITQSPADVAVTFAGQAALQSSVSTTGSLTVLNQTIDVASTAQDYLTTNYLPIGMTSPTAYCVANTPGQYPATGTIGQTGVVVTYACYTDSTMTMPIGTETISYAISAGTSPSTATASLLVVEADTAGQKISSGQTNYLIDTAGGISFLSVTASGVESGVQVNFTAQ